jgi:hypothetical protein
MEKPGSHCATVPELARLTYFYGQVLGPHELRGEQSYFREKQKLHNRCLHGFGVVCGLEIVPAPQPDPDPCIPGPARPLVRLECGMALDCEGNEIVVRRPSPVDLWARLDAAGRDAVAAGKREVFVYICFKERPVDPSRPALPDSCGSTDECHFARVEDCFEIEVSTEERCDDRCEPCCEPCQVPCLLLARICNFKQDAPVEPGDIDEGVRRMISLYRYTTVTGVNWVHGAIYRHDHVQRLLHHGLRVHFSRPVRKETIFDGIADLWVIHDERLAEVTSLEGELQVEPGAGEFTRHLVFRQALKERLQDGDRLLFTLRTPHILDRCCRPVDGAHVGGRVPRRLDPGEPDYEPVRRPVWERCQHPPGRKGPWTSGCGLGGAGNFESWLWVREQDEEQEEHHEEHENDRRGQPVGGGR